MKKKDKKEKVVKEKRIPVVKVGIHRKSVIFMWILLIGSVCFGIYKNFTAIDTHTIHEKEIVKEKMVDTNGIENFVKSFAREYYTWENKKEVLSKRTAALENYFTEELQQLNADVIRSDCPTSSRVQAVEIWNVKKETKNEYAVSFKVLQEIKEGKEKKLIDSSYEVIVYIDSEENMVIIKSPTVCSISGKSDYEPETLENDMTVKAEDTAEIEEFLNTFFKLYPTAGEKELAYYVKNEALSPINCKNYVFSEIVDSVYRQNEDGVEVNFVVKYLDQLTKTTQISQFDLVLEKENNWLIVKSK